MKTLLLIIKNNITFYLKQKRFILLLTSVIILYFLISLRKDYFFQFLFSFYLLSLICLSIYLWNNLLKKERYLLYLNSIDSKMIFIISSYLTIVFLLIGISTILALISLGFQLFSYIDTTKINSSNLYFSMLFLLISLITISLFFISVFKKKRGIILIIIYFFLMLLKI